MNAIYPEPNRWRYAAKIAACHIGINLLVAAAVAALVFFVWYPYPYPELMGGLQLLGLVIAVDVVCGPVLTFVLSDPKKSKREMATDLSLVGLIQLSALLYGLYAVAVSRPVAVAFEVDRFTVASAVEIDKDKLSSAPESLQSLPWLGARRVAVRKAKDGDEHLHGLELSLGGIPPVARPDWWLPDSTENRKEVIQTMRPLSELSSHYPDNAGLRQQIADIGLPENELYFLPFTAQKEKGWTVILDKNSEFKGFVQLDAFF